MTKTKYRRVTNQSPAVAGVSLVTLASPPSVTRLPVAGGAELAVVVLASDLRRLLAAADIMVEHHTAMANATPDLVGEDTLDIMAQAGVVDPDTLDVSERFQATIARASAAMAEVSGLGAPVAPF